MNLTYFTVEPPVAFAALAFIIGRWKGSAHGTNAAILARFAVTRQSFRKKTMDYLSSKYFSIGRCKCAFMNSLEDSGFLPFPASALWKTMKLAIHQVSRTRPIMFVDPVRKI